MQMTKNYFYSILRFLEAVGALVEFFCRKGKKDRDPIQGCQMVSFQTKNPNLDIFWSALDWKMLIYFKAICNISPTLEIFYDHMYGTFCVHLVHFSGFGIMYQERSGNPDPIQSYDCVRDLQRLE
jgi:hypothetical protein